VKIDLGGGAYIEPDEGPRNTRFHQRIVRAEAIHETKSGMNVTLECGHLVQDLRPSLAGGVLLCTQCRDSQEASG
jgi:hypothetical protein